MIGESGVEAGTAGLTGQPQGWQGQGTTPCTHAAVCCLASPIVLSCVLLVSPLKP
jgi:hypothetical protein